MGSSGSGLTRKPAQETEGGASRGLVADRARQGRRPEAAVVEIVRSRVRGSTATG